MSPYKNLNFEIKSTRVTFVLIIIVVILIVMSVGSQIVRFSYFDPNLNQFERFNLDAEGNIPTFFSTMFLIFSAVILGTIAISKKNDGDRYALHWLTLFIIFFLMAFDEAASLHDMLDRPLKYLINTDGIFYFTWVIPAMIFLLVFLVSYLKFWLHLPLQSKIQIAFAFILYISGALGFEIISGSYKSNFSEPNLNYILITNIEETLEFAGIVLFIYALLKYLNQYSAGLKIHLSIKE